MNVSRWIQAHPLTALVLLLGAPTALGLTLTLVEKRKIEKRAAALPPPMPSGGWKPVPPGESITLYEGAAYRACVELPWPVSSLASVEKVKAYALRMGFQNVYVYEAHPDDWAACDEADYYVQGIWGQATKTIDRPGAVVAAWEYR